MIFAALLFVAGNAFSQNPVADSSFEAGTPSTAWTELSTNFGTPLCDANCGTCGGPCASHSGLWYVWFGGYTGGLEAGAVTQNVTIPSGVSGVLTFWYKLAIASGLDVDTMGVMIGTTPVFMSTNADSLLYANYTQISIPITPYLGTSQLLSFGARTHGGEVTNFLIDDITIKVTGGIGVSTNHLLTGLNIYPNPTTDFVNIEVSAPVVTDYKISMYNLQGQKVYEREYSQFNNGRIEIDTRGFAKGTYQLVIDNGFENTIEKIMVQ